MGGGVILLLVMFLVLAAPVWAQSAGELWHLEAANWVDAVAVSADGQRIAMGARDNILRLFDQAGTLLWDFEAGGSILGVDLSADGQWIAVASEDRHVYLLDAEGRPLWKHKARRSMNNAAVADDGSLVAGTSDDRSFYVLDGQGNLLWNEDVGIDVEAVAIYGRGEKTRLVVGADDGTVSVYSRAGRRLLQIELGYDVQAVDVTANGALIVAGCNDRNVYLINGANGDVLWSFPTQGTVHGVAIARDGRVILVGSEDKRVYLLDRAGNVLQTFKQEDEVLDVALAGDGAILAIGTAANTGRVIDRAAAEVSRARAAARRRWMAGGAIGGTLLLVILAVLAVQYTAMGRQVWEVQAAGPRTLLRDIWKARLSYLLIMPTVILLLIFNYYPAFSGLYHAFTDWSPGVRTEWVGLDNFRYLIHDRFFLVGMRNAVILVLVAIIKTLTMPLLVAELIFNLRNRYSRYWFRTLFVVPLILPLVVEILLWNNIYDPTIGLANQTLIALGLEDWTRVWYGDPSVALASIIFIGFPWVGPFPLLIFYGGLISIPSEIFDAGRVDGASGLRRFWHIDLPLLMSQVRLLLILVFIGAIQTFELVFLTTGGGPGESTYTPTLELYYAAMRMDMLGLASAIGMLLFGIILLGTILNMRYVKSAVEYEA